MADPQWVDSDAPPDVEVPMSFALVNGKLMPVDTEGNTGPALSAQEPPAQPNLRVSPSSLLNLPSAATGAALGSLIDQPGNLAAAAKAAGTAAWQAPFTPAAQQTSPSKELAARGVDVPGPAALMTDLTLDPTMASPMDLGKMGLAGAMLTPEAFRGLKGLYSRLVTEVLPRLYKKGTPPAKVLSLIANHAAPIEADFAGLTNWIKGYGTKPIPTEDFEKALTQFQTPFTEKWLGRPLTQEQLLGLAELDDAQAAKLEELNQNESAMLGELEATTQQPTRHLRVAKDYLSRYVNQIRDGNRTTQSVLADAEVPYTDKLLSLANDRLKLAGEYQDISRQITALGPQDTQYENVFSNPLGYRELLIQAPPGAGKAYQQAHFTGFKNVLVHGLVSQAEHEGEPVRIVHEIQSDWNERGVREKGMITPSGEYQLPQNLKLAPAPPGTVAYEGDQPVASGPGHVVVMEKKGDGSWGQRYSPGYAFQTEAGAKESLRESLNPPPQPVLDDTQSYELMLKRLVLDAKEHGYSGIALPTSETVAKSYNRMLENVTGLEYNPENNTIRAQTAGRGWQTVDGVYPTLDSARDMIGDDAVARLKTAEPSKGGYSFTTENLDGETETHQFPTQEAAIRARADFMKRLVQENQVPEWDNIPRHIRDEIHDAWQQDWYENYDGGNDYVQEAEHEAILDYAKEQAEEYINEQKAAREEWIEKYLNPDEIHDIARSAVLKQAASEGVSLNPDSIKLYEGQHGTATRELDGGIELDVPNLQTQQLRHADGSKLSVSEQHDVERWFQEAVAGEEDGRLNRVTKTNRLLPFGPKVKRRWAMDPIPEVPDDWQWIKDNDEDRWQGWIDEGYDHGAGDEARNEAENEAQREEWDRLDDEERVQWAIDNNYHRGRHRWDIAEYAEGNPDGDLLDVGTVSGSPSGRLRIDTSANPLTVGGKGFRAEYDQALPNIMKKVFGKYGMSPERVTIEMSQGKRDFWYYKLTPQVPDTLPLMSLLPPAIGSVVTLRNGKKILVDTHHEDGTFDGKVKQ